MRALLITSLIVVLPTAAGAQELRPHAHVQAGPTIGQSVFAETPITRTALRYEFGGGASGDGFWAGASFGLTDFLSDRGDLIKDLSVGDFTVGASYDAVLAGPITFRPRMDVVLPASKYSRNLTMFFASHLGTDIVLEAGPITVTGITRVRRDIHNDPTPAIAAGSAAEPRAQPGPYGFRTAGSRLRGREEPELPPTGRSVVRNPSGEEVVVPGPTNTAWGTHLGLLFEGDIVDVAFVNLGIAWTHTWSYEIERPANVIASDGVPKRVQRNIHVGTLGGGFRVPAGPLKFEFRLGFTTAGRASDADGQLRFWFWNFEDPALDDSTLDLQIVARY